MADASHNLPPALIVEDDRLVRQMVVDTLEGVYALTEAASLAEARQAIAGTDFELVVVDHNLPDGEGTELLSELSRLHPGPVRVLMTGSEDPRVAMEAVNRGRVHRFFVKPVDRDALRDETRQLVERRAADQAVEARLADGAPKPDRSKARLLLVDDDEGVLEVFEMVLAQAGFTVTTAITANQALDHLGARQYDVLLADKNLPDLSGIEVVKAARNLHPDIESVVITAFASTDSAIEALEAGAYDYLRKPLDDIQKLPRLVERALERQSLGRERRRLLTDLVEANRVLTLAQGDLRRKMAEMELLQDATVMGLTRLAEYRDLETGEHLERMRNYARVIAQALEGTPGFEALDEAYIDAIYKAAPLHDIGKVGIPDRILCKPGALTPDEWEVMRTHPRIGGDTLAEAEARAGSEAASGLLRLGKHIAWYHHERWDGGGYPFGIGGDDIPIEARIVMVADAYDAITSKRVYKPSHPHDHALELLKNASGTQFDARVVEAFIGSEPRVLEIKERWGGDEVI